MHVANVRVLCLSMKANNLHCDGDKAKIIPEGSNVLNDAIKVLEKKKAICYFTDGLEL